jgi:hypothetical protein
MNWILAGAIALAALGMGWLGKSWQDGQQAKVDLQEARESARLLNDSLTLAKTEADKLRGTMGEIANDLEISRNENAARATSSQARVRTVVQNTPSLAAGRVPADFVRLFNDIRSPRDVSGSGSSAAGSIPPAAVPAGTPDTRERRR